MALHVTARGNYQQSVFHSPEDRTAYLDLLARHAAGEGLRLLGWCLMTKHVHLLVLPECEDALGRTMKRAKGDYARFVNRRHFRAAGHLWPSRYYSCLLDGDAVWTALRYIERNPVRAGIGALAESSAWSSAAFHCGVAPAPACLELQSWRECWDPERWRTILALGEDERMAEALRQATQRGIPLVQPELLNQLRRETNREFVVRPVGRPRLRDTGSPVQRRESAQRATH